ncbi:MAG: GIY-YIG nuclease family protein [Bacteroidetes bacterium]|nr:MAG: GIY-YIG nuclease family protein [Bacteroidota bacterium]
MEMKYFVYVLKSTKDGRLYKGMTNNIKRRIYEHSIGKHKSTRPYRPWNLVFTKELNSREEARELEKWLKSGIGREFLKSLLDP